MNKTKKQLVEEQFHDEYALTIDPKTINIYENFSLAAQENRYARSIFTKVKGKKILDLGCGFGETAIYWAKKGAEVESVDISEESIKLAQRLAKKFKVTKNCRFQPMATENLRFPANYFDFVFGNGVLHHIDIPKSIKEVNRVLKKEGKAVFVEPLAYNPAIDVYRQIADKVRTPTERPLTFAVINKMKKYFPNVKHTEFHFFTLLMFVWFFLIDRVNPNRERYWRKILKVKGFQKSTLRFLITLDSIVLKLIPPLRYLCWNTVIELKK